MHRKSIAAGQVILPRLVVVHAVVSQRRHQPLYCAPVDPDALLFGKTVGHLGTTQSRLFLDKGTDPANRIVGELHRSAAASSFVD